MQKKRISAQPKYQPKTGLAFLGQGAAAPKQSPRWNPASGVAAMIARKVIDKQKAGELTARSTSDPEWERKKNDLFAYAESIDGQTEAQADSRKAGPASLRVDTSKGPGSSRTNGPSSPAQRIKCSRGPRADLKEHSSFEKGRVEELWQFTGDFTASQFEGEKPGYDYRVKGCRGAGYYKVDGSDSAPSPQSPAQRISDNMDARAAPKGWVASQRTAKAPAGEYQPSASRAIRPTRRPVSAHPSSTARVTFNGANTARDSRANVPELDIQAGAASARPTGVSALGLNNRPKARPRSAAISREANRAGPVAGAWRASQSRAGGTTRLW